MPSDQTAAPAQPKAKVPVIDPKAVFTIAQARETLQLAKNCLPREIRLGRLRVAKRAGKYLILGAWLLEWVEAGEIRRGRNTTEPTTNGIERGQ